MLQSLHHYLQTRLDAFLAELAQLSAIDCGSHNKAGVDHVGQRLRARLEAMGLQVTNEPHSELGDTLVARLRGTGTARLLLIGHLDTVYPDGWTATHPFTVEGDVARGPSTADMKAGVLAGIYALEALQAVQFRDFAEIAYILNSDEEIGSPSSRAIIEREAQGRDAVLVLECGRENGDIVSARKGIAHFALEVHGRSAHAGVEPERGRHAILELAHQTIALQQLNGAWPGVTVNVGVVHGGTVANVVPAEAQAQIDVRARDRAGLDAVITAIHRLAARPTVEGTSVVLTGGPTRPPMEKTAATARLVTLYQAAARELSLAVNDAATGGTSDANFTSALGIPTLDGLGPVGGLDHGPNEYVLISSIVPRTALLASLIQAIAQP